MTDYMGMKADELRRLCRERGIAFPSKATKAQLAQLLEAYDLSSPIEVDAVQEVEAETVDDSIIPANALAVDVEAMGAAAVELTEAMDSAATALGEYGVGDEAIASMPVSEIRICEDGIAAALRDVDDRRKELTRLLTEPKKAIDARVKELTEPLKALGERYADRRQEVYMEGYKAQYEECCIANGMEALLGVVPFDGFIARYPKWTMRTANPVKTQEKIADEVVRIARDWETLRGLEGSMRFYDEAERTFFETLDLNAAIDRNKAVTAQQERVDAMRREQEEAERWRAEQAAKQAQEPPAPAWTPEFEEVEPEPAPTPQRSAEPARNAYAEEQAHMRDLVAEHVANGHPERRRYHFEAWLDDAELASFREWKNACGIGDGWTFREVR